MKKVYYVSTPYHAEHGECEVWIMDEDDNHELADNEFDTLEEAKAHIVKEYETIIAWYQKIMTNIQVSNNIVN